MQSDMHAGRKGVRQGGRLTYRLAGPEVVSVEVHPQAQYEQAVHGMTHTHTS